MVSTACNDAAGSGISSRKGPARKKAQTAVAAVVMLLCGLLGLVVLFYPVVSTQINNYEQAKLARQFGTEAAQTDPAVIASALDAAHAYNASIGNGPLQDPWTGGDISKDPSYQEYESLLGEYPTMAQMTIPAIAVNLPVYHGTSDDTLLKGVGHLYGTALPVGGLGTRSVLTAHSGIQKSTFFDNLEDVKRGDAIYIRNIGETLKYQVRDIEVIVPTDIDRIQPVPGKDLITLITCTPYGINTHRLLVTAERVPMDPGEAEEAFAGDGIVWQWWMKLAIGVLVVILMLIVWLIVRILRAKNPRRISVQRMSLSTLK
ncbi:TPA: class C sortase [Corynebacterium striatum]|nr:class C sortase [Corynebacterium striatum]MDC7107561.1 class C sortase [Corynebacterium striatum]